MKENQSKEIIFVGDAWLFFKEGSFEYFHTSGEGD